MHGAPMTRGLGSLAGEVERVVHGASERVHGIERVYRNVGVGTEGVGVGKPVVVVNGGDGGVQFGAIDLENARERVQRCSGKLLARETAKPFGLSAAGPCGQQLTTRPPGGKGSPAA